MLDVEPSADPLTESLLRLSFQTSDDAIAMLASDGTVLRLNHSAMAAFRPGGGVLPSRLEWFDVWNPESRDAARSATRLAARGEKVELVCARSAGAGVAQSWRSVIVPLPGARGEVVRLLATSRNVTAEYEATHALEKSARVHEALIAATSEIVWHFDVASGITDRQGWSAFTGEPDDACDADSWLNFVHPDDRDAARIATDRAMLEARPLLIEYRMRHRSGEWRWVEDHATPLLNADGTVSDWVGILSDIHDRHMAEEALRSSEQRLRLAVEATGLATWELDAATGRQSWSRELAAMLRIPEGAETTHELFLSRIHPDDRKRADREFETAVLAGGDGGTSSFRLLLPCGEERWIEGCNRIVRDEAGRIVRHIGTLQDITARKQAEREVWLAAYRDALTGVANRALFQLRLDAAIATAGSVGLIMVDLDNFKDVNDSLGHDAGDALLRATAERLTAAAPPAATVARLGGDEFGIVVPMAAGSPALVDTVETCLAALRRPVDHDGKRFRCTASLGWALCPEHDGDAAALLKDADLALYAVKAAGRNAALPFHPDMRAEATRRLGVLRMAGEALAANGVFPFYQPKVSLATGAVVGFEALLRWTDAHGLRSPGEIGEAFEDPELAMRLGARMLERVAADMREWADAGIPFGHVALNVGAREFRRDEAGNDLPDRLSAVLAAARLPASSLHVEITERVLLDDDAEIVDPALRRLGDAGIRIALDDFGTGYASLTHLRKYPVSHLKIDRSFVAQVETDKGALAIVRALVGLARSLRITAVAEGAETDAQIEILRKTGCDVVQGYAFGRPMAAAHVPDFLKAFEDRRLGTPSQDGRLRRKRAG